MNATRMTIRTEKSDSDRLAQLVTDLRQGQADVLRAAVRIGMASLEKNRMMFLSPEARPRTPAGKIVAPPAPERKTLDVRKGQHDGARRGEK